MADIGRPTTNEVKPLLAPLAERAGCCLHIVLDECNVDDGSVAFCRKYAEEQGHVMCVIVADLLVKMTKTQRLKLAATLYKPAST